MKLSGAKLCVRSWPKMDIVIFNNRTLFLRTTRGRLLYPALDWRKKRSTGSLPALPKTGPEKAVPGFGFCNVWPIRARATKVVRSRAARSCSPRAGSLRFGRHCARVQSPIFAARSMAALPSCGKKLTQTPTTCRTGDKGAGNSSSYLDRISLSGSLLIWFEDFAAIREANVKMSLFSSGSMFSVSFDFSWKNKIKWKIENTNIL